MIIYIYRYIDRVFIYTSVVLFARHFLILFISEAQSKMYHLPISYRIDTNIYRKHFFLFIHLSCITCNLPGADDTMSDPVFQYQQLVSVSINR